VRGTRARRRRAGTLRLPVCQSELVPICIFLDGRVIAVIPVTGSAASHVHSIHTQAKSAAISGMALVVQHALARWGIQDDSHAEWLFRVPAAEIGAQYIDDGDDCLIDKKAVVVSELNGYPDRAFIFGGRELAVFDP